MKVKSRPTRPSSDTIRTERRSTMAPKRIRIELFPNVYFRRFHVTAQISAERLHGGILGGDRHNPFKSPFIGDTGVEFSDDTKSTVMQFYAIDGVETVGLDSKAVEITQEPAYDWGDFESEVIATIKAIVGWGSDDDVRVDYSLQGEVFDYEPLEEQRAAIEQSRISAERHYHMFSDL